jgi:hypothetical protein
MMWQLGFSFLGFGLVLFLFFVLFFRGNGPSFVNMLTMGGQIYLLLEHSHQHEQMGENNKKWGGGSKTLKHQPPYTIENPWLMNSSSSNLRSYCSSFGE